MDGLILKNFYVSTASVNTAAAAGAGSHQRSISTVKHTKPSHGFWLIARFARVNNLGALFKGKYGSCLC